MSTKPETAMTKQRLRQDPCAANCPLHSSTITTTCSPFMDIMPRGDGQCLVISQDHRRATGSRCGARSCSFRRRGGPDDRTRANEGFEADALPSRIQRTRSDRVGFHLHVDVIPRFETAFPLRPHTE